MLTRVLLLLAVASCCLSTRRVTPSLVLPDMVDNMIYNTAEELSPSLRVLGSMARNIAHLKLEFETAEELLSSIKSKLPWVDVTSFVAIAEDIRVVDALNIRSHFILKTTFVDHKIRYTMVNLYKTEDGKFGAVMGQHARNIYMGVKAGYTFHDVKASKYGFPQRDERVVQQSGRVLNTNVREDCRADLINALKDARANQNSMVTGLGQDKPAATTPKAIEGESKSFLSQLADGYREIADAFKTVFRTEFKEKIPGEGFDHYKTATKYLRTLGLPIPHADAYLKDTMQLLGFHGDGQTLQETSLVLTAVVKHKASDQAWASNALTFDKDKIGTCDSTIVIAKEDQYLNRYHFYFMYVKGSFKLAPHVMVWQKYKSYVGGIFEETKDEIRYEPRELKPEEVNAVNAMMTLSGIQMLADKVGLKLDMPEIEMMPWKG